MRVDEKKMTNGIPLIAGGTIVIIREHEVFVLSVVIEKEAKCLRDSIIRIGHTNYNHVHI